MAQCDEIFQEIQRYQELKRRLTSGIDYSSDPSDAFVFETRDGSRVEVSFEDLWARMQNDGGWEAFAEKAAGRGDKPYGADGKFENFGQLVDRLGFDDAVTAGAFLQRLTGDWAKADPADYFNVIAVNDREKWTGMVNDAFRQAGLDPDDSIIEAITVNGAPFLDILSKQTKLEVFDWVTKNNLKKSINAIQQGIAETGMAPARELKVQFTNNYRKAMYAHRTARLAKRRSGQLLQNYQRYVGGELTSPEQLNAALQQTMTGSAAELEKVTQEVVGATVAEMTQEDKLVKRVIDAANKGEAGLPELEEIQTALDISGVDAAGDDAFDEGWDQVWRKNARAGYKDSALFNPKTQLQANYVSQKLVYLVDGFRTAAGQGWDLYGRRVSARRQGQQAALEGITDPVLPDVSSPQRTVKVNPLATGFFRDAMKAQLDGARIATQAASLTNDLIRQTWKESIREGFAKGNTPFAGNADSFIGNGTLSIPEQYKVAQEVLDAPFSKNPAMWPLEFRNKLHHSFKLLGNKALRGATGIQLPVYSALQMMSAVDQRAGLRNYMTIRMNDLMLEQAALYPDRTLQQWADAARAQADDQIYQASPTEQNIKDAREEFGLEVDAVTDDEVAEYLVAQKIGAPVMARPGASKAYNQSVEMRMQGKPDVPVFNDLNLGISNLRRREWGDSFIAFWKSPVNQIIWDWGLGMAPARAALDVAQVAGLAVRGKEVPVELLVRAQASTFTAIGMLSLFEALDSQGLIEGGGPLDPKAQRQYRERLAAEGKVPNSIAGVPFPMGGLPLLNTLFLYKDLKDAISFGGVSEWDQQNLGWDLVSVLAGSILRMPGFSQVRALYGALADGSPNQLQQAAAFWGNTAYNPASGLTRLGEWATGQQSGDLQRPVQMDSSEERFDLSELPENHPLRAKQNGLRDWLYYSNPSLSKMFGAVPKEATWLGRDIRRPDGFFRSEWPIGVPGIWEFNKGDYFVEAQLEQLGLLDPPTPILTGVWQGIQMTEDGRSEFNRLLGTYRAPDDPAAFEDFTRTKMNGLTFTTGAEQALDDRGELSYNVEGSAPQTDLTDLMNRVVRGNTVREALNELFRSPEWAAWRANPLTTWDPSVRDLPPSQRNRKVGPFLVQAIKNHYTDMAGQQFELSGSGASNWWFEDKGRSLKTEAQTEAEQDAFDLVNP